MSPIRDAFRTQWTTIVKVIGFNLVNGVGFYMCFIYMTTWLLQTHHFSQSAALALVSFSLIVLLAGLPVSGIVSDHIGRKPLLLLGSGLLALLAWPLFWLISQPSIPLIVAGLASFSLIVACFGGACPAFMVEAFPKHVRCSGLSVGYNLSLSIFGGTVPMVSVALIAATGDRLAPAFYLMLAAALSFVMGALINAHPDEARPGTGQAADIGAGGGADRMPSGSTT